MGSQEVKMIPELENSHGGVDPEVPDPSSHRRLWGGEGAPRVACGKAGGMGGGKDSLSFWQDHTGCLFVCELSVL